MMNDDGFSSESHEKVVTQPTNFRDAWPSGFAFLNIGAAPRCAPSLLSPTELSYTTVAIVQQVVSDDVRVSYQICVSKCRAVLNWASFLEFLTVE